MDDVSLMAGKGPISDRRCVRRRRCRARKPLCILGPPALLGQSSGNACCSGVLLLRLPRAYLGDLLASHPRLASTCVARNTDSQFSQWQGAKKVISWCLQSLRGVPRDAVFIALFGFRDPRASGCKTLATAANWGRGVSQLPALIATVVDWTSPEDRIDPSRPSARRRTAFAT
jgi:hypothetical protein